MKAKNKITEKSKTKSDNKIKFRGSKTYIHTKHKYIYYGQL